MAIDWGKLLTGGILGAAQATPLGGAVSGIAQAVTGGLGGGKGTVGGTVLARGRGIMMIQTPAGNKVLVRTAKRRRYYPRSRGTSMEKLMQMAVMKSLMK